MKLLVHLLASLGVMAVAVWAYAENNRTRAVQRDLGLLAHEIAELTEQRMMLEAEIAYLVRPDRLEALVARDVGGLGLAPMRPAQFARADEVPYPLPDALPDALPDGLPDTLAGADRTAAPLRLAEGTAP